MINEFKGVNPMMIKLPPGHVLARLIEAGKHVEDRQEKTEGSFQLIDSQTGKENTSPDSKYSNTVEVVEILKLSDYTTKTQKLFYSNNDDNTDDFESVPFEIKVGDKVMVSSCPKDSDDYAYRTLIRCAGHDYLILDIRWLPVLGIVEAYHE